MILGLAESCTGGLVSAALTSIPGSSDAFACGLVTYANWAKMQLLGVTEETLKAHGAVSAETAIEMASGLLEKYPIDIGAAITGIAGPGGGSVEKPVGLVYIATKRKNAAAVTHRFIFQGERQDIQRQAAEKTLDLLQAALGEQA